ncbi:succinyldiaminopimelate aminotransferase apoenzyme [Klenkia marina]|uniref:Succinyldiaminopimelate aminotransferase apoenzyme n=1 Tax=Klenkia marina TaxID=1960309 RepID=A0A1G4YZC9_9ACTN|nr:pyridoxal phosphate-dependent aminotransferase [Klenkia marina]SCX58655.1 succinyldiaminopimelate aminotransferase apoenzyme [Klenkia marina]
MSTHLAARLQGFGTTVFAEMSALAVATGSVNLGQGFPDTPGPAEVLDVARAAIGTPLDQYPPGPGLPVLREAIAAHVQRFRGLAYDPGSEVLVTAGATEALAGAMLGLLDPGDEVMVLEPLYDSYAAGVAMAGGVVVPVPLRPPPVAPGEVSTAPWTFDPDELRAAVTPRTKLVLLNTPHNPTGKVLDRAELEVVADVVLEHDLLAVTDEVYEHLVFSGAEHVSLAQLPGMRERTLVVGSGGKTFSTTGWKVGWVCGPAGLVACVRTAKQFLTYVNAGPFQPAIAAGLGLPDAYFTGVAAELEGRRDRLVAGLAAAGLPVVSPQATYFATARVDGDGLAFCRELPHRVGVVAVPMSAFYTPQHAGDGRDLVRFAFCKRDEVLDEAVRRLTA